MVDALLLVLEVLSCFEPRSVRGVLLWLIALVVLTSVAWHYGG